jgi:hypothetical protein
LHPAAKHPIIPLANLPPVSLNQWQVRYRVVDTSDKFSAGVIDKGGNFAADVVDTGGAPWIANISANFRKNSKLS